MQQMKAFPTTKGLYFVAGFLLCLFYVALFLGLYISATNGAGYKNCVALGKVASWLLRASLIGLVYLLYKNGKPSHVGWIPAFLMFPAFAGIAYLSIHKEALQSK